MMSRLQRRNHIYNKIFFGNIQCSPLPLRRSSLQTFLSRKAEGYGPMKPWQPRTTAKGANSITLKA
jgi:hypothetical protein